VDDEREILDLRFFRETEGSKVKAVKIPPIPLQPYHLTRIRLIAEYIGNSTDVLWVDQKPKGVYAGWHIPGGVYAGQRIPGFEGHFSYHQDGEFHFRLKGPAIRYPRRPAFGSIRGLEEVVTFYIPKLDSALAKLLPGKRNKPEVTISVDMASLKERYLQVRVWLMEPMAFEALDRITAVKPDDSTNPTIPWVKVFDKRTPWLLITGNSSRTTPYGDYNVFTDES